MNPSDLAQFADVIAPPSPPLFPPAPGWYLFGGMLLACLLQCGGAAARRHRENRYRREALREMAHLKNHEAVPRFIALLDLLRRTAIAAYGRQSVAPLEGEAWWRFLNRQSGKNLFEAQRLNDETRRVLYANALPDTETVAAFERACAEWIRRHKRSAS